MIGKSSSSRLLLVAMELIFCCQDDGNRDDAEEYAEEGDNDSRQPMGLSWLKKDEETANEGV